MTKPALVFIHGRGQGGKDPIALRDQWIAALRVGLGEDADRVLDGVDIRFPFYGDELDTWVKRTEAATPAEARGAGDEINPDYLAFQQAVVEEILAHHGLDAAACMGASGAEARGPTWVLGILRALDHVPGVTGRYIAAIMRDVYLYLRHPAARAAVDRIVAPALSGRCVIVAHSLGTVVTYRLLKSANEVDARLLITLGSPLGIGPIRAAVVPRHAPRGVANWINALDNRDTVALFPLGRGRFSLEPQMAIEDIAGIDNQTHNHHGIVEYLNKAQIARRIGDALEA
jgi:hypothetical protein